MKLTCCVRDQSLGNKVIKATAGSSISAWTFVTKGRHTGGSDLNPGLEEYQVKQLSSSSDMIWGISATAASAGEIVTIYTMEE